MHSLILFLTIPLAFLTGSIPFGLIFTKNRGIDIKNMGSRNIGATNVLRYAGRMTAIMTLVADVMKGVAPVLICRYVILNMAHDHDMTVSDQILWEGMTGIAAVCGHIFSIFLRFRGGKGVATGFGVIAIYTPMTALPVLIIWLVVAVIAKYSSLAAILAVGSLPILYLLQNAPFAHVIFGILLSALIIYRHKSNIQNLLSGTEDKIGEKDIEG
jgi:glycerol-3-phosphate acyltransferase PlsY